MNLHSIEEQGLRVFLDLPLPTIPPALTSSLPRPAPPSYVSAEPDCDPDLLTARAKFFLSSFENSQDVDDLNKAIKCAETAQKFYLIDTAPLDHFPERSYFTSALEVLTRSHFTRYLCTQLLSDIEASIRYGTEACALFLSARSNASLRFYAGASYYARYRRYMNADDMRECVAHFRTTVTLAEANVTWIILLEHVEDLFPHWPELMNLIRSARVAVSSYPDKKARPRMLRVILDTLYHSNRRSLAEFPEFARTDTAMAAARHALDVEVLTTSSPLSTSELQRIQGLLDRRIGLSTKVAAYDDNRRSLFFRSLCLWSYGRLQMSSFIHMLLVNLHFSSDELLSLQDLVHEQTWPPFNLTLCEPQASNGQMSASSICSVSGVSGEEIIAISFSGTASRVRPFIRSSKCLRYIMSLDNPIEYLLTADLLWVPSIMHLLQLELEDVYSSRAHRKKCFKCLRTLAKRHSVLPPTLLLPNVRRFGTTALRGGGFADIWKGVVNDRTVCLKVLRMFVESDERNRESIIAEFCHEALLWKQLKHPNVLPFMGVNYDVFAPGFCLISPWMENGDVVTYLKQNPSHDRLNAIFEICKGLSYIHSLSPPIIHGDIRGANILVTDDGKCCLADFGLALASESHILASTTGSLKGSVRWMAPELIDRGLTQEYAPPKNQFPRDIYAFACTIFEILTGLPPFSGFSMDISVIFKVVNGERPIRPTNVWFPDSLWSLVEQGWDQTPEDRPQAHQTRNFVERLCIARDQGDEEYLTLAYGHMTSTPVAIILEDDSDSELETVVNSEEESQSGFCYDGDCYVSTPQAPVDKSQSALSKRGSRLQYR